MRIDGTLRALCLCLCLSLGLAACGDDSSSDAPGSAGSASDNTAGTGSDADTGTDTGADTGIDTGADTGTDTGTDGGDAALPGSSADELAAFLDAESYRGEGWTSQTDAPRDRSTEVSPHGRVRVWRNDALLASQAKGNGAELDSPKHDTGSMAVKEFYDNDDQLIGRATMLKLEGDEREWAYYCSGPDDRCMDSAPVHGIGFGVSCSFCHGGLIFTK